VEKENFPLMVSSGAETFCWVLYIKFLKTNMRTKNEHTNILTVFYSILNKLLTKKQCPPSANEKNLLIYISLHISVSFKKTFQLSIGIYHC